jgi:hypothetical protein
MNKNNGPLAAGQLVFDPKLRTHLLQLNVLIWNLLSPNDDATLPPLLLFLTLNHTMNAIHLINQQQQLLLLLQA